MISGLGLGSIILLALDIWALVSVIGSNAGTGSKVIWVLVILFLPLVGFIAWDFAQSDPVNLRLEPPMITAGSGQAVSGGHCAMPK